MQEKERINKFAKLIEELKNGKEFTLIKVVNRDETDEVLRNMIINVLETGDIRNLDYEFDGGNINLAYRSVEDLVYSLILKRECPVINLYKATKSINPVIIYRENQKLSYDKEKNKLIFRIDDKEIIFDVFDNIYTTAVKATTEMSRFKMSPDPSIIIEFLEDINK